jgi:hypothetical protein
MSLSSFSEDLVGELSEKEEGNTGRKQRQKERSNRKWPDG